MEFNSIQKKYDNLYSINIYCIWYHIINISDQPFSFSHSILDSITLNKWDKNIVFLDKYTLIPNKTMNINDYNKEMRLLTQTNPELLLWEYCDYKVYLFHFGLFWKFRQRKKIKICQMNF